MYIKNIKLNNFRNYKDLNLDFSDTLNIFTGKNAQGKTNILEAIYLTSLCKSFRTNKDSEMINFSSDIATINCNIWDEGKNTEINIALSKDSKKIKVDNILLQRTSDLIENVYIVVFSPDDLRIIKDGPENRRRFIDRELCQIKPIYYSDLGNYKRVLKQRNILLKNKNIDKNLLDVFDESLADYGLRIVKERYKFTRLISEISKKIHCDISDNKENLEVSYETKINEDFNKEDYKKLLKDCLEEDLFKGYTSKGPHKDDLCVKVNDMDIRSFGSQGQQRTAALSLKLSELELIKKETGKNAVLLLDDVLSELDPGRQSYLIKAMNGYQVFITSTFIEPELKSVLPEGRSFIVDNAKVEIYNH